MTDRPTLNPNLPNVCTIRRPGLTVAIVEDQASVEDVARACRDAMLGLGYARELVEEVMPE